MELNRLQQCELEAEAPHGYAHPVSFGKNVRRLRLERDLNGKTLAELLGVKQSTLSGWERDRGGLPEGPTLIKFAKALGCSLDDLLAGVDPAYDEIVIAQRDLPRHGDPESSSPAHSHAQRKGTHDDGISGAAAARIQQHLTERTAFVRDIQNVTDLLIEVVDREEKRLAREGRAATTHAARRRRHHRKAG